LASALQVYSYHLEKETTERSTGSQKMQSQLLWSKA